jgi:polysaccharide export outer membrane protein
MWMSSLSNRLARVALLGCLSLISTGAWGSASIKSSGIPIAARVEWAAQSGKKEVTQPKSPGISHIDDDYIIGASDVLDINVWKDPELTQKVPVRPDGRITLPLIGELQVSGLTAMNVQLLITQRLSEFISKPIVAVTVMEMRSRTYTIVGKIVKPGSYDLSKPTTALEAIAIAGGFVDFAKTNKVYILRRQSDGTQIRLPFHYKKVIDQKAPEENVNLKNGDTIVVP